MTVLCFSDTRFPIERANGVQTVETCHALARRGHDIRLVVRPDSATVPRDPFEFYGLAAEPRLQIKTISARGPARARRLQYLLGVLSQAAHHGVVVLTRDLGVAAWLLQLPKSRRPHVVYESHGISSIVAREMPALLGKPELMPSESKLRRLDRRERRVWQHAPAYVAITRALADELQARYGKRTDIFVVPDGARSRGALPPPAADRFIAGYAGHLYPWKGVDTFIRSLVHAPGVDGLVVGGHPREDDLGRITQLVQSLGLSSRVTITGLVPPAAVASTLSPASVLVLPNASSAMSERYTSPLKLFEYLTMGRAIVASDFPSIREVVEDGRTARLVPPGDERALGAALVDLKDRPDRLAALARGAAELAPGYSWDVRAERLEAALEAARRS